MFLFNKKIDLFEKIHRVIAYFIRVIFIVALIDAVIKQEWVVLFISFVALFLTFLPYIIERSYRIHLPIELQLLIVVFIFASLYLGELHGYYTKYLWWDVVLHTGAGLTLGLAGFILLYVLYEGKKIHARPSTVAFFSFCFALALGALWEIFEFTIDRTVGTHMQKGLLDTMSDLIVDSVGALLTSFLGYLYLKRTTVRIFDRSVRRFLRKNSGLFKRR